MANPQYFTDLFQKYLDGRCSPGEVDYLMELMKTGEYKALALELIGRQVAENTGVDHLDASLTQRLESRLQFILEEETPKIPVHRVHFLNLKRKLAIAAAVIAVATTGLFVWMAPRKSSPVIAEAQPAEKIISPVVGAFDHIRNITLPDGSSVVLHAGSKLDYVKSFDGPTREVRLEGEAYFDIAHNPDKPFIIHTGKVKTTVLGTSFNIKADAKHVVVSVTRGRVKVEDESKLLAVLTPDQQVQYSLPDAKTAQQTVNANTLVTDWTKEDMVFNGVSFEEIAAMLSKRYGVPVKFKNQALKNCKIRASFSGTEKIEQVASVLSGIRNGSYQELTDGTIVLDGEGCDD